MAEKRYYWMKLQDDFFDSKRIKKLRRLAGGDTFTIIYLKMQLLAMKHDGMLEYAGLEDSFAKELALDLDEDDDNVAVTVNYLLNCGLLETSDDRSFFLPYAVANTGSEGSSAKRMRDCRERKAALETSAAEMLQQPVTEASQSDETSMEGRHIVTERKRRDREETEKKGISQLIVDLYNETCVSLPRVRSLSDARKKAIKARMNLYTLEDFKTLFEKAQASDFLKGKNARDWMANFDWLVKDANMAKVLDGCYDSNRRSSSGHGEEDDDVL